MVIKAKPQRGIEIDLSGPGGNAYALLGTAHRLAVQLDLEWEPIRQEMTSGDYEHLIATFDKHFGEWVTLYS